MTTYELASIYTAALAAAPQPPKEQVVPDWQPIETAPSDTVVVVAWLDDDDKEHPERYGFDYKENGVWVKHDDLFQEFCCVAPPGSHGPKATAPYTHWMPLPQPPKEIGE